MNKEYLDSLQATGNKDYFESAENFAEECYEKYISKHIPDIEGKRVLEIACGHGRNCNQLLKHHNPQWINIVDINQDNVDFLIERFKDKKVGVSKCDGTTLNEFKNGTFDFIYTFDSMVHFNFTLMQLYVKEIKRTLKKDGVAYIHFSNAGGDDLSSESLSKHGLRGAMTNDAMLSIIEGFEVIHNELIDWGVEKLDAIIVLKKK